MKKVLTGIFIILLLAIFIKFFVSNYEIKYNVDGFSVSEKYENGKLYFEISNEKVYNFDLLMKRKLGKKLIKRIEVVEEDNEICIYPVIKNETTYPLCYKDDKLTAYHMMKNESIVNFINSLDIYKKTESTNDTFKFYNNLSKETFIAVYKYNGFYILNDDKIRSVNVFSKDRYDNSLCLQLDYYLIFPEESEYNFKNFIVLDMLTGKTQTIKSEFDISFDAMMLGFNKKKVYILDQKNSKEYEIDLKKKEVNLIGDYEKGFKVLKNGKLKTALLSELKENSGFKKVTLESEYNYYIEDGKLYKTIEDNTDLRTIIFDGEAEILNTYLDNVIFLSKDTLYLYNPLHGLSRILVNEELNYNNLNTIYVYNNN